MERLEWKNKLIAEIDAAQSKPPLSNYEAAENYRKAEISGTFLHDKSIHMVGRPRENTQGFFILTPLKLNDDSMLLVNRGWAPKGAKLDLPEAATIKGVLRPARQKRYFSPTNQPEKNVWFFEDMDEISAFTGVKLLPLVLESTEKQQKNVYPAPGDGKISLRNDHLGYAITWFALAATGLIMFGLYHRKPE